LRRGGPRGSLSRIFGRVGAKGDGLHRGEKLLQLLDERFDRRLLAFAPYFFPDLADTTDADEQAAIAAGLIRATRIDWVGGRR
jgi:hypothetical protein